MNIPTTCVCRVLANTRIPSSGINCIETRFTLLIINMLLENLTDVHCDGTTPVIVKSSVLGGMIMKDDTLRPMASVPASNSLGVEVYHTLIPELSTVPVL